MTGVQTCALPIFDVLCCSYYNGQQLKATLQLDMRPNATFQFAPKYTYTYLDMPGGLLNIHALSTSFITNFTPDMQVALQAQYDNISKDIGFLARYRWEYQPGSELFAALGQSALVPHGRLLAQSTQFSLRLGHTFRF